MLARRVAIPSLWFSALVISTAPALAEGVHGSAEISFAGTSTLHDFVGTAGSTAIPLSQDANRSWSADMIVSVAGMKTGNRWRDADMREMFDIASHPQIRARFRDVDAEKVRSGGVLSFVLRIRTVERPMKAAVTNWKQTDREASFDAAFDVSLRSFQLEAPQTFFLSVADKVRVTVHVTLERE